MEACGLKFPNYFLSEINQLLCLEEQEAFFHSYQQKGAKGLRVNVLKVSLEEFVNISPFHHQKILWSSEGLYFEEADEPGKHPFYDLGLYYIQEPSAQLPVEVLNPKPNEKVLDLCAAPGGKSVAIASKMQGKGLLVSNDPSASRVRVLVKNIEMQGILNCLVTNEVPENLAKNFKGYFDKILVDAPCSGEGMFRKDPSAIHNYQKDEIEKFWRLQKKILASAHEMLRPGGILVYSTCTFNQQENENVCLDFVDQYPYKILPILKGTGFSTGLSNDPKRQSDASNFARLWPHNVKGEGHFVACFQKNNGSTILSQRQGQHLMGKQISKPDGLSKFEQQYLVQAIENTLFCMGENIYTLPYELPNIQGIKVAKFGLFLGQLKGNRFEPAHSFLRAMNKKMLREECVLSLEEQDLLRYLKGETIVLETGNDGVLQRREGLFAVFFGAYPVGWGKLNKGILKNLYPKGWVRR